MRYLSRPQAAQVLTEKEGSKDAGIEGKTEITEVISEKEATILYPWILVMLVYAAHLLVWNTIINQY